MVENSLEARFLPLFLDSFNKCLYVMITRHKLYMSQFTEVHIPEPKAPEPEQNIGTGTQENRVKTGPRNWGTKAGIESNKCSQSQSQGQLQGQHQKTQGQSQP